MKTGKKFLDGKKSALEKLKKARSEKNVDPGILPVLDILNECRDYYTTSSCFGRIVLLEIPGIGDKKEAEFLGKWHRAINIDELLSASKKAKMGQIWLLSQSPIIHVTAITSNAADKLLKTAISSGFKNSGVKSLGEKVIVEICSTERLDVPVGKNGSLFCNEEYLQLLVDITNKIMKKSNMKLGRFEQKLKKYLSTCKTTQH